MACGVPVVASVTGGIPEVVVGDAGVLLPVGDAEGMGEAALALLSDEARHRVAREAARGIAVERFSAERVVPIYEGWYERVIAGAGAEAGAESGVVAGAERAR
jgi:L-malate glycosyltransferase